MRKFHHHTTGKRQTCRTGHGPVGAVFVRLYRNGRELYGCATTARYAAVKAKAQERQQ